MPKSHYMETRIQKVVRGLTPGQKINATQILLKTLESGQGAPGATTVSKVLRLMEGAGELERVNRTTFRKLAPAAEPIPVAPPAPAPVPLAIPQVPVLVEPAVQLFKVGDLVRHIFQAPEEIGKVTEIGRSNGKSYARIAWPSCGLSYSPVESLRLVEAAQEDASPKAPTERPFKVGDRVTGVSIARQPITGTVIQDDGGARNAYRVQQDGLIGGTWCDAADLHLVEAGTALENVPGPDAEVPAPGWALALDRKLDRFLRHQDMVRNALLAAVEELG